LEGGLQAWVVLHTQVSNDNDDDDDDDDDDDVTGHHLTVTLDRSPISSASYTAPPTSVARFNRSTGP